MDFSDFPFLALRMEHALIYSYKLDGDGAGKAVSGAAITDLLKSDTLAWAHLWVGHPDTEPFLKANLDGLDPAILQALLADETRPRASEIDGGFLIILRGANTEAGSAAEDLVSVRLWIDERRIISLQRKTVQAVADIARQIDAGRGPVNSGRFLAELVEGLTRRLEPVITQLDDAVDDIEENFVEQEDQDLRGDLTEMRKRTIGLRRYLGPQRDAMSMLQLGQVGWLHDGDRRSLHENHDRLQRMVEDLDALRERSQIIKDELSNALAEKLNRNMYLLSVIGAIFLPLGFLTGLMGINIGGMPGVGSASAFWIFTAMLVVFVAVELVLFRMLKWI